MSSLQPTANFLLVAVPERHQRKQGIKAPDGTLFHTYRAMDGLDQTLRSGGEITAELEADDPIHLTREGLVLRLPTRLDRSMVVCDSGIPGKPRTCADITPEIEVGDTVHLDPASLADETEIEPGVYRVPYTHVLAVIKRNGWDTLIPVGGYAFLRPVWDKDVTDEVIDGETRKCRVKGGLVLQADVPPLPNEGVVRYVGTPLRDCPRAEAQRRVIFDGGAALRETIGGEDFWCVQQDKILAVRNPEWNEVLTGNGITIHFKDHPFWDEQLSPKPVYALLPLDSIHYN
ncbi:hypothetical protein [Hymenobacter koreensis]|uniref:Uncharacterized protein n=1 Tax=Hymenobacter koreensis TaxID=1084523 RepID=A0ABP8JJK8_9BACT